jgi:hypothetical protein
MAERERERERERGEERGGDGCRFFRNDSNGAENVVMLFAT